MRRQRVSLDLRTQHLLSNSFTQSISLNNPMHEFNVGCRYFTVLLGYHFYGLHRKNRDRTTKGF